MDNKDLYQTVKEKATALVGDKERFEIKENFSLVKTDFGIRINGERHLVDLDEEERNLILNYPNYVDPKYNPFIKTEENEK